MEAEFKNHEVIPDVIHKGPEHILKVNYPHSNKDVHLGNVLTPHDVKITF